MFLHCIRPAGQGLVQLFDSSPLQSFFNGAAPKELYPEKGIYRGMLRKVRVYGAAVSQEQQLVKTGEFIRITDNSEVRLKRSINIMVCIDELN